MRTVYILNVQENRGHRAVVDDTERLLVDERCNLDQTEERAVLEVGQTFPDGTHYCDRCFAEDPGQTNSEEVQDATS